MIVTLPMMHEMFDRFNDLYFNGSLRKPTLKLSRGKSTFGFCGWTYVRGTTRVGKNGLGKSCRTADVKKGSEYITISTFYDQPREEIENTMIHEMIHLWFVQSGRPEEGHGYAFRAKCREINKKSGTHLAVHVSNAQLKNMTINKSIRSSKKTYVWVWKCPKKAGYEYGYCTCNPVEARARRARLDSLLKFWNAKLLGEGISSDECFIGECNTITPRRASGRYFRSESEMNRVLQGLI